MEMWLANLIPCMMVFVAFIINMLFIPSMTQAIFGGAAGLAWLHPELLAASRHGLMNEREVHKHVELLIEVSLFVAVLGVLAPLTIREILLILSLGVLVAGLIYACVIFKAVSERSSIPMSAPTAPIEATLTPEHALLADQIGNEVYASHYAERKAYRFSLAVGPSCFGLYWNELLAGPPPDGESVHPDRRDGTRSGHPLQRPELQPA